MDRRTFIKSIGAIALLNSMRVSDASQLETLGQLYKSGSSFPEIRVIVVGSGGWKFLNDHYFSSNMQPNLGIEAEKILFIGRNGSLCYAPQQDDQNHLGWDFSMEGEGCERDLGRIEYFKTILMNARTEIAHYIQPADWIVLVASLDNGMAFAACDEIPELCRAAGVKVIGLLATPYHEVSNGSARRERFDNASEQAVNKFLDFDHSIILDIGYWGASAGDPMRWGWYMRDSALGMISQVSKSEHIDIFSKMISGASRLDCVFGCAESAVEAIQEAIEHDWEWTDRLDGTSRTAAGGVIRLQGHPDMVDQMKSMVLAELQNPDQFTRGGRLYWRKNAQFIVTVEPDYQIEKDQYFLLDVLSTGVEVA